MNGVSILSILLMGLQIISGVVSETVEICDAKEGADCITTIADEFDCLKFGVNALRQALDACMTNFINQCDDLTRQQWQASIDALMTDFTQDCDDVCAQAVTQLDICNALYGGLSALTEDIMTNDVQPTETQCAIALKRVHECMINATRNCQSQEEIALRQLRDAQQAFDQCNILIKSPPINNGTTNNITTTTQPVTEKDSTKTVIYTVLGLSALVVLITGGIAMYIWMRRLRNYNHIKGKEEAVSSNYTANGAPIRLEDSPYFVRDRSPLRTQQFRNQQFVGDGPNSIPPFASGTRWWTRPGFGQYGTEGVQTKPF